MNPLKKLLKKEKTYSTDSPERIEYHRQKEAQIKVNRKLQKAEIAEIDKLLKAEGMTDYEYQIRHLQIVIKYTTPA